MRLSDLYAFLKSGMADYNRKRTDIMFLPESSDYTVIFYDIKAKQYRRDYRDILSF